MKHVKEEITKDTKLIGRKEVLFPFMRGKILDIGCGEGEVLIKATLLGHDITGVDISKKELDVAHDTAKKSNVDIKTIVADANNLPFERHSFDTIILGEVLEHLPEPGETLAYLTQFLKDKGTILITMPAGFAHADADHKNFFFPRHDLGILDMYWVFDFIPTMFLTTHKIIVVEDFFDKFSNYTIDMKLINYNESKHQSLDFFIIMTKK